MNVGYDTHRSLSCFKLPAPSCSNTHIVLSCAVTATTCRESAVASRQMTKGLSDAPGPAEGWLFFFCFLFFSLDS